MSRGSWPCSRPPEQQNEGECVEITDGTNVVAVTCLVQCSEGSVPMGRGCWGTDRAKAPRGGRCLTQGLWLLPQGPRSPENLNYTSLLFPGKGHGPGSARDYENMKPGADYVNVDPKKKKVDFWACSSPVASKSIEYTEVKL